MMKAVLFVGIIGGFLTTTVSAASICDGTTIVEWTYSAHPAGAYADAAAMITYPTMNAPEAKYELILKPECNGTIAVVAHERGKQVRKWRTEHTTSSPDGNGGTTITKGPRTKLTDGASLRLVVDGTEICRKSDGSDRPPGSGTWAKTKDFYNYVLDCNAPGGKPITRSVVSGSTVTVAMYRWNINAAPYPDASDGLRFQVRFTPNP